MSNWANITGRTMLFTLAGVAAGLLTWFFSDLSGLVQVGTNVARLSTQEARDYWIIFACWGALVAVFLSVADALVSIARPPWLKILGIGFFVGVIAGMMGGALGMGIFGLLYSPVAGDPFHFLLNVIARAAGWALIGALAGTAPGWRKGNFKVGWNGFIGGLLGGLIGGAAFEIIPYLLAGIRDVGIISRLFGFAITGAMIGLFIALVQELFKEAWLRVVLGRNEGRDVFIEKAETTIGRYELCDIPLFGDTTVARQHAVLLAQPGGTFILRDTGESPVGTVVNGQRISGEVPLNNGDQIRLGNKSLVFYERFTRTRTAPAPKDVAAPASAPVIPGVRSLADALPPPGALIPPDRQTAGVAPLSAPAPFTPISSPAASGLSCTLVAVSGPHVGQVYPVRAGATIGRDITNTVALVADRKASRLHARLEEFEGALTVVDHNSTNGTYLNGQRVTRQTLASGDIIVVGTTSLRIDDITG